MFQKSQDQSYMKLIVERLKEEKPLVWTNQFCNLLKDFSVSSINDIGCQVGQFYKALKYNKLSLDYYGFDIEKKYLKVFNEKFKECKKRIKKLDISKQKPTEVDASIISATLEHIENYKQSLENILQPTKKIAIVRTFLGEEYKSSLVWKEKAKSPYLIQQFDFETIYRIFNEQGFVFQIIQDEYTKSIPQFINLDYRSHKPVFRTQYIILAKRDIC